MAAFTVTIEVSGVPLTVSGDYNPGRPGTRYNKFGDPGDPPEGEELIIESIEVEGVDIYPLIEHHDTMDPIQEELSHKLEEKIMFRTVEPMTFTRPYSAIPGPVSVPKGSPVALDNKGSYWVSIGAFTDPILKHDAAIHGFNVPKDLVEEWHTDKA